MTDDTWRHCNICNAAIAYGADYFRCNVSTCDRRPLEMRFCSLDCWQAHLPEAKHRDAWALPERAPSASKAEEDSSGAAGDPAPPRQAKVAARSEPPTMVESEDQDQADILIVVSKLKKYIKQLSGMNTSDKVAGVLSDHLRDLCREAVRRAGEDGRRTVLERDFETKPEPDA